MPSPSSSGNANEPVSLPKTDAFAETSSDISDVSWSDIPVLIIFWTLMAIVMLQFFTRYVLNDSLGWTEEIARYLLIFLTFVGSITCVRQGSHIFLEFFFRFVPAGLIKPMAILVELVNTCFFLFAGYFGIELAIETAHQSMVSIPLPKGIIYWTVVVCCFVMAILSLKRLYSRIKTERTAIADELLHHSASVD